MSASLPTPASVGGMVQSRDKNGMRGFEGKGNSGEWNTGAGAVVAAAAGKVQGTRSCLQSFSETQELLRDPCGSCLQEHIWSTRSDKVFFLIFIQFLRVSFIYRLIQNIVYIPHVVPYILELLLHPTVRCSCSPIPIFPSTHW